MKYALYTIVMVSALLLGVYLQRQFPVPDSAAEPGLIATLPEISLQDLEGRQRNINEWQGKIIILNFWATWCPPCLKEIPEFKRLQHSLSAQNVQFIGIAIEDRTAVQAFVVEHSVNYPILIAEHSGIALAQQLGNSLNVLPFSIVVDRQGRILHRHSGEFKRDQILEIITPLLSPAT